MYGKGKATGSLVCGIISLALAICLGWLYGIGGLIGLILGIVGLVMASGAKKEGFVGGTQTAGFVLSLLGLIFGAIFFAACGICTGSIVGCAACGAASSGYSF